MENKKIVTIRKASQETGASMSFFKQLLREKQLTKFRINSAVYVDLHEFEKIAKAEKV